MRTPEWVTLNVAKGRFSPEARLLYCAMLAHRNSKSHRCTASQETLADELDMSLSTVKRRIEELQRLNLITKEVTWHGRVRRNEYIVHVFDDAPENLRRQTATVSRQSRRQVTESRRQPRRQFSDDGSQRASSTGSHRASNSLTGVVNSRSDTATGDASVAGAPSALPGNQVDTSSAWGPPPVDADDDFESLPTEAMEEVLLWHVIQDGVVIEAFTEPLNPYGCRGCGCRLTDREFSYGQCADCERNAYDLVGPPVAASHASRCEQTYGDNDPF